MFEDIIGPSKRVILSGKYNILKVGMRVLYDISSFRTGFDVIKMILYDNEDLFIAELFIDLQMSRSTIPHTRIIKYRDGGQFFLYPYHQT